MKFDLRLTTGILIGVLAGLHYHVVLAVYAPLVMVAALVLVLKILHP